MALRYKPDFVLARLMNNDITKKLFNTDVPIYVVRTGKNAFEQAASKIKVAVDQIHILYNKRPASDSVIVSNQQRSIKITSPRGTQMYLTESQAVAVGMFIDTMLTECANKEGEREYPIRSTYPFTLISALLKDLLSNISASCMNAYKDRLNRRADNAVEGWELLVRGAKQLGLGYQLNKAGVPVVNPVEVIDAVDLVGIILDEGEANVSNH